MKISEFWQGFKKEYAIETDSYAAYAFGEDADELAQLVLSGKKTATSSLYLAYGMSLKMNRYLKLVRTI